MSHLYEGSPHIKWVNTMSHLYEGSRHIKCFTCSSRQTFIDLSSPTWNASLTPLARLNTWPLPLPPSLPQYAYSMSKPHFLLSCTNCWQNIVVVCLLSRSCAEWADSWANTIASTFLHVYILAGPAVRLPSNYLTCIHASYMQVQAVCLAVMCQVVAPS